LADEHSADAGARGFAGVALDIYGYRTEIRCSSQAVLDGLADDFAFFRTNTQSSGRVVELFEQEPCYDELPQSAAAVYTPRNVSYRDATCTYIDYSGRALGIHDRRTGDFRVFSRNRDLLYEAAYLFLLSQAGEALDARHLHRVHALGVNVQDCAALVLLPMGGGKSTLGSHLLQHPDVKLLSDDSPLIDRRGDVYAFPLRIGLLPGAEGSIPASALRKIERMEFGPKLLVSYSHFADKVSRQAKPCLLLLGRRSLGKSCTVQRAGKVAALRAMAANCVVGMGLFQGMEFVFTRGAGELFRKSAVAASRLRASLALIARSQTYYLTLGRDPEENARVTRELLVQAAERLRRTPSVAT